MTSELAAFMGYNGADLMAKDLRRLTETLRSTGPMTVDDWTHALAATEIAFASEVWGSGLDWPIIWGLEDAETISSLRSIQRKLRMAGLIRAPRSS